MVDYVITDLISTVCEQFVRTRPKIVQRPLPVGCNKVHVRPILDVKIGTKQYFESLYLYIEAKQQLDVMV